MKPLVRRYVIEPYGTALYVAFAASVEDGVRVLPKDFTAIAGGSLSDAGAITLFDGDQNRVAVVFGGEGADDVVSHRKVAHEAWHAADRVMAHVGVRHRASDNNEAFAYVCGLVAEYVYDAGEKCRAALEKAATAAKEEVTQRRRAIRASSGSGCPR